MDSKLFKIGICTITDKPEEILNEFRKMDIEIFCRGKKGYIFDFLTISWIENVIKKFQAHIVHTHNNKGNFHGRIAALLKSNTSIVTTHHDASDLPFSKIHRLKNRKYFNLMDVQDVHHPTFMELMIYPFLNVAFNRFNSKIITVSSFIRGIYSSDPNDSRFETVYAPYDDTLFKANYNGFKKRKITLGIVGRFAKVKGHIYLLQAMKKLIKTNKNVLLKIIGDGFLRSEFEAYIKKHNLEDYICLCGHFPHNATLYKNIDIYIQPSLSEGCPIAVLEAMGVGIPVIACNVDGLKEIIISNETGMLIPPKNPDILKDAIIYFIENKAKALRFGRAGNKRVLEKFSTKTFIKKMTYIYQELAFQK